MVDRLVVQSQDTINALSLFPCLQMVDRLVVQSQDTINALSLFPCLQMVDRLVVQSQDTINALSLDSSQPYTNDIEVTKAYIKDADRTKTVSTKGHKTVTV